MQHLHGPVGHCECGRPVEFRKVAGSGQHREITCSCGRVHDVEFGTGGWIAVAYLTPERSVPLSGFSAELRQSPDVERYWFSFPLRGGVSVPVHLVMSRSADRAEVKAADLKAYSFDHVSGPTEVRRRWISWWRTVRSAGPSRRAVAPPRRVGRLPANLLSSRRVPAASH